MPQTARYRILTRRLAELRVNLLPKAFSPTGQYSRRQLDRARGYRLLAHAEIEAYIEDAAREAVLSKLRAWKSGRNPSQVLLAFMAAYHSGFGVDESDATAVPAGARERPKDHIDEIIDRASQQFNRRIEDNHGVRIDNLKRLLLPLGIDFPTLDQTWLTNMDEFGKRRGEVAHKTAGAQRTIDPRTEYQYVRDLLVGLAELDRNIVALR